MSGFKPNENYTGMKFGHLRVKKIVQRDCENNPSIYECDCEKCGKNKVFVSASDLYFHNKISCGCVIPRGGDLIGAVFGKLTVIGRSITRNRDGKPMWDCRCECGKIIPVLTSTLMRNKQKSCGCLQTWWSAEMSSKNLIGQKFGRLIVVRRASANGVHPVKWVCRCSCGELITVRQSVLLAGDCKSCGCHCHPNLVGTRFGKLVVIAPAGRSTSGKLQWKCKCDCGAIVIIKQRQLHTHGGKHRTMSCGCLNKSSLVGQRFGKLTVISGTNRVNAHGSSIWKCLCDCGKLTYVARDLLVKKYNAVKSCGCLLRPDLSGKRFGKLVVEKLIPSKRGEQLWRCKCDCGNIVNVPSGRLLSGHTQSCGCYKTDVLKIYKTKEDFILSRRFNGMKQRCYNEKSASYPHYGGRGIYICDEWLNDIWKFIAWSKSNGFKPELSLDRIDVNGPYSPGNCRWVSMYEQNNNKTTTHFITIDNIKLSMKQWLDILHLSDRNSAVYYKMPTDAVEKMLRRRARELRDDPNIKDLDQIVYVI